MNLVCALTFLLLFVVPASAWWSIGNDDGGKVRDADDYMTIC